MALAAVVNALGREPLVPPLLTGIVLTGLIGSYTEFVPLIGPALVVATLVRPPAGMLRALRAATVVLAVAVVAAPLVWVRAVQSLLFLGGMSSDYYTSSFVGAPLPVIVGRFLGIAAPDATDVSVPMLVIVVAFVVVGILAAVLLTVRRWFYATLVLTGVFLAVYMVTVRARPYPQQRVVQLLLPLVLLVVAAGWDRLWRLAREREARAPRTTGTRRVSLAVAIAGLLGAGLFVVTNSRVDHAMALPEKAKLRHVGPAFEQAANWVREVGGDDGDEAAVLVGDFFAQLWITDALRDQPDVSYPSLHPSYQYQTSYWDVQPRRWLLTDRSVIRRVDSGVVVRSNARFSLLDLSRGRAVVAVPADVFGQNSYLLLRSTRGPLRVKLLGKARPRTSTDVPPAGGYGEGVDANELRPDTRVVLVELGASVARRLVLSDTQEVFVLRRLRFG